MTITMNYDVAGIDLKALFEQEQADTKHKTGYFCGTGCEWYTKRDGSGQRVIKVAYYAPRVTEKKLVTLWDGTVAKVGHDTVRKNELFPFTLQGLKAAVEFAAKHNEFVY